MNRSFYFVERTWEEIGELARQGAVILFPIGQVEEHGKHLPVGADAMIAEGLCTAIGEELARSTSIPFLVLPCLWSGYSAKALRKWPGTIALSPRTVMDIVEGVCGSLIEMGFRRLLLLNAHGHHSDLLRLAAREIGDMHGVHPVAVELAKLGAEEFQQIRRSAPGGAIHGCEYETSLLLHFRERVEMSKAVKEPMEYHSRFYAGDNFAGSSLIFWSTWSIQQSRTGIYGDPTVASAETGRRVCEAIVRNAVEFIKEFVAMTA